MLTGYKTLIFGLWVAIAPAALTYLGGFDWTSFGGVSPAAGALIGAAIVTLRAITSTPIGKATS